MPATATTASATVQAGAMRPTFDQHDRQCAESEHRQRLAGHVEAALRRGRGIRAGSGTSSAARARRRARSARRCSASRGCRSARRRGWGRSRCSSRRPSPTRPLPCHARPGSGNAAAAMARPCGSIMRRADALDRARGQQQRQRRRRRADQRRGDERHQADRASSVRLPKRSPSDPAVSSTRGEGDVVGVDRPLRAGDAAAEVVADRGQREVDRVGVDEADEKSQVGSDQGETRCRG